MSKLVREMLACVAGALVIVMYLQYGPTRQFVMKCAQDLTRSVCVIEESGR